MSESIDQYRSCWDIAIPENLPQPAQPSDIVTKLMCNKNALRVLGIPLNSGTQAHKHTSTVQRRSSLAPVLCSIVSVYSKKRNSRPLLQLTLPRSVCWPWPTDLRLNHARKTWYHNITSWPARAKNIQVSSEMDFYEYFNSEHIDQNIEKVWKLSELGLSYVIM